MDTSSSPTPLLQARQRALREPSPGDEYGAWLLLAEVTRKYLVATLVSILESIDSAASQRVTSGLLRDGNWSWALSETIQNLMRQDLDPDISDRIRQVTRKRPEGVDWADIQRAVKVTSAEIGFEDYPRVSSLFTILEFLTVLRNKTKGHGAKTVEWKKAVLDDVSLVVDAAAKLVSSLQFVYAVGRDGGERCLLLTGDATGFVSVAGNASFEPVLVDVETTDTNRSIAIPIGRPSQLLRCDLGENLFYFFNGLVASSGDAEFLEYLSGRSLRVEIAQRLLRSEPLPRSETSGSRRLDDTAPVLNNLPSPSALWVRRLQLERHLKEVLTRKQNPVISLHGPGGSGKTSLALNMAWSFANAADSPFDLILWMSARDIDLLPMSIRETKRDVTRLGDIAEAFCGLLCDVIDTEGEPIDVFRRELESPSVPYLMILDNFETLDDPTAVQEFLVNSAFAPAKIVITSRLREYSSDLPINVGSLEHEEAEELIVRLAREQYIEPTVTDPAVRNRLIDVTDSRAYPIKMAVALLATGDSVESVVKTVQQSPELLRALFRRSYESMSPGGKYLSLLLGTTGRTPELLLEVCLNRRGFRFYEAEREVTRHSIASRETLPSGLVVFTVPDAARNFLGQQLPLSRYVDSIEQDRDFVRAYRDFSFDRQSYGIEVAHEIARSILDKSGSTRDAEVALELLERLAQSEPAAWSVIASVRSETGSAPSDVVHAYKLGLEDDPGNSILWNAWINTELNRDNFDRAIQLFRQALDIVPGTRDRIELVRRWFELRRTYSTQIDRSVRNQADAAVVAALETMRSELDVRDLSLLAWSYVHIGRQNEARRVAEEGLRKDRHDANLIDLVKRLSQDYQSQNPG